MLNVNKVNKQIRKSTHLYWKKIAEYDIFFNGYWLVKVNLSKQKYRKILGVLVEIFGTIPSGKEMLVYKRNYKTGKFETTQDPKTDRFDFFLDIPKAKVEDTKLIEKTETGQIVDVRIFKGDDYIYINRQYTEMIRKDGLIEYFSVGKLNPIYAVNKMNKDEFLMMLPIRIITYNSHLKEIEPTSSPAE